MTVLTDGPAAGAARRASPAAAGLGARARLDAAVRAAAGVLLGSALLLVTHWWYVDGGLGDLTGWADGLVSAARLAGLLASVMLLAQVLAMARVPVLERAFGQTRLAQLHRFGGFASFTLMLTHIGLVTWGYAAGDLAAAPGAFWDLAVNYPGMLLAVAGTACLVLVVVTSIRAARSRLRYESWHLLHLYAYLGAGLVLPHQLWTGEEFTASPARTAFWWGLWLTAALAVLVWRLGLPAYRNLRHRLRVDAVTFEPDDVVSVHLTGRDLHRLPAEAGQFLQWRFRTGRGWSRAHPYSLSAAPDGHGLRISVKDAGDGSGGLRGLRTGTRVLVEGPYGRLTARARTSARVLLVGAGVGITPLRALAEEFDAPWDDTVLLHRHRGTPLFARELDVLARERRLRVVRLPGRRRAPGSWLGEGAEAVEDGTALRDLVPDVAERDVYVCGPPAWAGAVRDAALAAGVPSARIHLESFRW